jgi:hypothetical protein
MDVQKEILALRGTQVKGGVRKKTFIFEDHLTL